MKALIRSTFHKLHLQKIYHMLHILKYLTRDYELLPFRRKYALDNLHTDIKRLFRDKRNGIFIEVGANDGITLSNTAYLERYLGWKGILIEAIPQKYEECRKNRPRSATEYGALVSFDWSLPTIEISYCNFMSIIPNLSSRDLTSHLEIGKQSLAEDEKELVGVKYSVPAVTLAHILKKYKYNEIDFFSLDVEGAELEVLKGINFEDVKFKNILIETSELEKIEAYLAPFGYTNVAKLTHHDYLFKPKD